MCGILVEDIEKCIERQRSGVIEACHLLNVIGDTAIIEHFLESYTLQGATTELIIQAAKNGTSSLEIVKALTELINQEVETICENLEE